MSHYNGDRIIYKTPQLLAAPRIFSHRTHGENVQSRIFVNLGDEINVIDASRIFAYCIREDEE
jgi:hypothetical protein